MKEEKYSVYEIASLVRWTSGDSMYAAMAQAKGLSKSYETYYGIWREDSDERPDGLIAIYYNGQKIAVEFGLIDE